MAIILSDKESTGTPVKHKQAFYLFLIYSGEFPDTKHALRLTDETKEKHLIDLLGEKLNFHC